MRARPAATAARVEAARATEPDPLARRPSRPASVRRRRRRAARPGVRRARPPRLTLRTFTDSDHVAVRSYIGSTTRSRSAIAGRSTSTCNNERVVIPGRRCAGWSASRRSTRSPPPAGRSPATPTTDFVKVRNEVQRGLTQRRRRAELLRVDRERLPRTAARRELDRDFHSQQLNLSFGCSYGWDAIEPLADDDTQTPDVPQDTLHWNAVATQIVTSTHDGAARARVQHRRGPAAQPVSQRLRRRHGRRRSATRTSASGVTCSSSCTSTCATARASSSDYRFYDDDWGIHSHEFDSQLSQYVTQRVFARLRVPLLHAEQCRLLPRGYHHHGRRERLSHRRLPDGRSVVAPVRGRSHFDLYGAAGRFARVLESYGLCLTTSATSTATITRPASSTTGIDFRF